MDWIHTRRGPEWKQRQQGWGNWTKSSISAPPFPLLAIFTIVISLISLSQYVECREQMHHAVMNLKLLLFLAPVVLVILLTSSMARREGWLNFQSSLKPMMEVSRGAPPVSGFPWGVAAMLVVLLVLVSYQSSFQPKWATN